MDMDMEMGPRASAFPPIYYTGQSIDHYVSVIRSFEGCRIEVVGHEGEYEYGFLAGVSIDNEDGHVTICLSPGWIDGPVGVVDRFLLDDLAELRYRG